ncbi:Hypothetical protein D9617_18g034980 [Elsinoe fawcettii]|nr:Hypothetical protein D9617_18g034980 [Elsinoe fawcettii]
MSATETQPQPTAAAPNQPRRGNHHGRHRRPRLANAVQDAQQPQEGSGSGSGSRRGRGGRNPALAMRPASLPPVQNSPHASDADTEQGSDGTRSRRNGGRGRGGAPRPQRTVNGRAFGGALTQDLPDTNGQLQADAVEFVPGQPLLPTHQARQPPVNAPKQRL